VEPASRTVTIPDHQSKRCFPYCSNCPECQADSWATYCPNNSDRKGKQSKAEVYRGALSGTIDTLFSVYTLHVRQQILCRSSQLQFHQWQILRCSPHLQQRIQQHVQYSYPQTIYASPSIPDERPTNNAYLKFDEEVEVWHTITLRAQTDDARERCRGSEKWWLPAQTGSICDTRIQIVSCSSEVSDGTTAQGENPSGTELWNDEHDQLGHRTLAQNRGNWETGRVNVLRTEACGAKARRAKAEIRDNDEQCIPHRQWRNARIVEKEETEEEKKIGD